MHNSHPHIIAPHPPIHTARCDLSSRDSNRGDGILGFRKTHNGFLAALLTIPYLDRAVKTASDYQRISFASKGTSIDASGMATPAPQSLVCGDVPEKHGLVAADTDEAVVVLRNADIVDFVAVSAVFLYFEAGGRVEEANVAVGATGQELW